MEGDLQNSPQFNYSVDSDDSKYLAGLSTILVATIQEVKDRISQIEFIFCSQLFPKFQSRSRILQKRLAEARKAAEDELKKKESFLLRQIEELHLEKQQAHEQIGQLNSSLEQDKERLISAEQLLAKHQHEKKELLDKLESLERNAEIVVELKEQLRQKTNEVTKGKELQEKLLQQIELKDNELLAEQSKRRGSFEEFNKLKVNFKQLKSQYNFLLGKSTFTTEYKAHLDRTGEEKGSSRSYLNKRSLLDSKDKDQETAQLASKPSIQKIENDFQGKLEDNGDSRLAKSPDADPDTNLSSSSSSLASQKFAGSSKPEPLTGLKRAKSSWRDTRTRHEQGGADPHDDFLDTPMEIVRNLNKGPHEEVQVFPVPAPKDMDFNNSDDETQDITVETVPLQRHISILGPENKGIKYVEPVRKKAERETLKGVECKQCKKFYDAVLPDGGDKNNSKNNRTNLRCEHHDGVSRHRYRYAPPMTPDGFWNIGFDSDL